jgi:ADP-ribose pyrophosphatase YjhB (NUDIX family)
VSREYPDHPRVGVGAVVLDGTRVLLVQRGGAPLPGKWSLPGGLLELGETTAEAARREVAEECGLDVEIVGLAGILDRVVHDAHGRIRYHWVLVDYLARPRGGTLCAGDDAADARWVAIDEVAQYDTTDGLMDMIKRAVEARARIGRGFGG